MEHGYSFVHQWGRLFFTLYSNDIELIVSFSFKTELIVSDECRWYTWMIGVLLTRIIPVPCQGLLKLWNPALFGFQLLVVQGYVPFLAHECAFTSYISITQTMSRVGGLEKPYFLCAFVCGFFTCAGEHSKCERCYPFCSRCDAGDGIIDSLFVAKGNIAPTEILFFVCWRCGKCHVFGDLLIYLAKRYKRWGANVFSPGLSVDKARLKQYTLIAYLTSNLWHRSSMYCLIISYFGVHITIFC